MSTSSYPTDPDLSIEDADAYDRWYRAKVQASLDNLHPLTPHDEVIAELRKALEARRDKHASRPLEP